MTAADFEGLDAPVVVGCSGGADSLALLALAAAAELAPVAVYVDHGLRPPVDRAADLAAVRDAAARLGVGVDVVAAPVPAGPNLEARARRSRYRALEAARRRHGAGAVLVGHTADDQAETVLLALLRGSGVRGLAGMAARRGRLARPLLGLRRRDTERICRSAGLAWVHDATNDDLRLRRNRVRHRALPELAAVAERDLVPVLTRQARILRDEADFLDDLAADLLRTAGIPHPATRVLADAPRPLARRAVRLWLGAPPPSAAEVERVLRVVEHVAVATELRGGRRIWRTQGRLRLSLASPA